MKKIIVICCIFVLLLGINVMAEPPREGYSLVFSDEFDGNALNREVWNYRDGSYLSRGGRNDEKMVTVSNGELHIGFDKVGGEYHGGGIFSKFGLGYGYYEVRSKLFGETGGLHSSFWVSGLNGDGVNTPAYNRSIEIDFYEVDSNKPANVSTNIHYWIGGHLGAPKTVVRTADNQVLSRTLVDTSKEYFVMGCEYLPDRTVWYLNGTVVCEGPELTMYGRPNLYLTALANTELSGEIDESKLPGESVWDYFRFYTMPFKGQNIVVNPSFDDNNRSAYQEDESKRRMENPASWIEPEKEENVSVEADDKNIRTGTGSLKINKKGTVAQDLNYIGNGKYQMSLYYKSEGKSKLSVKVNDTEMNIGVEANENFAKLELDVAEITDNRAYITISADGDAAVYIDDVELVCLDGTAEYNRKNAIDPFANDQIMGEVGIYDSVEENENVIKVGKWLKSGMVKGVLGKYSAYSNDKDAKISYKLVSEADADYSVQVYRMSYDNSCTDAKATVYINGTEVATKVINLNDTVAGFEDMGIFTLKKGDEVIVELARGTNSYLRADSARIIPASVFAAKSGLVLKISDNKAYCNLSKRFIDPDNKSAVPYVNENNRTLIPLRYISEEFGATVSYSGTPGVLGGRDEIKIELEGKTLLFATDVPKYSVNGEIMDLDAPPENKMSRTYVPVRALSEAFGKKVYYNDGIILLTDNEFSSEKSLSDLNGYLY